MKKNLSLFFLIMSILVFGCKSHELDNKRDLPVVPSEIRFTSMDMTDVKAIAIMKTVDGKVATKAGGEPVDRLCVVDKYGNVELASFNLYVDVSDDTWRKVVKTLTLVPRELTPLSDNYLHLDDVSADVEWVNQTTVNVADSVATILPSDSEIQYIIDQLYPVLDNLRGGYILRLSDGALFRSPYETISPSFLNGITTRASSDGRSIIFAEASRLIVMSDAGDVLNFRELPLERFNSTVDSGGAPIPYLLSDGSFLLIPYGIGGWFNSEATGVWSFDLDLNPYFLDYASSQVKAAIKGLGMNGRLCIRGKNEDYVLATRTLAHLIKQSTSLDYEIVCKSDTGAQYLINNAYDYKEVFTDDGMTVYANGATVYISLGTPSISVDAYPSDFPKEFDRYDANGIAIDVSIDKIVTYNLNDKSTKTTTVKWDTAPCDKPISGECFYSGGDYYTIKGTTRNATSIVVLVEIETGNVSLTDLTEFSGSVVTSYYRLN